MQMHSNRPELASSLSEKYANLPPSPAPNVLPTPTPDDPISVTGEDTVVLPKKSTGKMIRKKAMDTHMSKDLTRRIEREIKRDPTIDIALLEFEYVEGFINEANNLIYPTIAELLERNKVDLMHTRLIAAEAIKSSWRLKRDAHRAKLRAIQSYERTIELAKKKETFDVDCLRIAEVGIGQIKMHMMKYIAVKDIVPVKDLERLARTFQKFQIAGKLALGDRMSDLVGGTTIPGDETDSPLGFNLDNLGKDDLKNMSEILAKAAKLKSEKDQADIERAADEG